MEPGKKQGLSIGMKSKTPARLFLMMAHNARVAVILRRGPTGWTQLIKWNLDKDYFDLGQWFKGRVYEEKCDLSPYGKSFVYFASKYGDRQTNSEISSTWTAMSRPPYFTAIGLWPNGGTTYGGGGIWRDDTTLLLNHTLIKPGTGLIAKGISVVSLPVEQGDLRTIFERRLSRDGWKRIQEGRHKSGQSEIWERSSVLANTSVLFERSVSGRQWKFYLKQKNATLPIPSASWVDWDHHGRLIVASAGKIWASGRKDRKIDIENLHLLIDLNNEVPAEIIAPGWATR